MDKNTDSISVAEAAELLGVSRRHVARLINQGKFATVYKHAGIRGPYLLNRQEVEAKAGQNND